MLRGLETVHDKHTGLTSEHKSGRTDTQGSVQHSDPEARFSGTQPTPLHVASSA